MPPSPRLVLIGGGHANIALLARAQKWTNAGAQVTLLTDERDLLYSGMTPQHLAGRYGDAECRVSLLRLCLQNHVRFVQGRAARIDLSRRSVFTEKGEELPADLAVLDVGGVNPLRDKAGGAVLTKPLHRISELAAWLEAPRQAARSLVIVGGGAAGTEIALNLSARNDKRVRLKVVESAHRLLPEFPVGMGRRAESLLRARGVDLRLSTRVARVEQDAVVLEGGERVPGERVLWATGTIGQAFLRESGLSVNGRGFVRVDRTLRARNVPWLFAGGDCVSVVGLPRLDRSGVNAVKQGYTLRGNVGRALRALSHGETLSRVKLAPFRPYPVAPYILSTGTSEGMVALGPAWLHGPPVLWLKHAVDRRWVNKYQG